MPKLLWENCIPILLSIFGHSFFFCFCFISILVSFLICLGGSIFYFLLFWPLNYFKNFCHYLIYMYILTFTNFKVKIFKILLIKNER